MNTLKLLCPLLITVSASVLAQQPADRQAALVEVVQAKQEMLAEMIQVPGTVISRTNASLASEVAGKIAWMADVGDVVTAGQPLAILDDRLLQLDHQDQAANIKKLEARVNLLTRKQGRFAQMQALNNTSKDELDEIESDLAVAEQDLAQAHINLAQTAYFLSQTKITAGYDALVVERLQSPGEYTAVGTELIQIVDTKQVEASIRAPLSAVPFVKAGQMVSVSNGRVSKQQRVRAIVPVGNALSRMMEIRVSLAQGDFPIGGAVTVSLPHSDYHHAVTVPRDALVLRKDGVFVFQIDSDEQAQRVAVSTGVGAGDRIEVVGEIDANLPVIVRGAERLKAGQKVRLADDDSEQGQLVASSSE